MIYVITTSEKAVISNNDEMAQVPRVGDYIRVHDNSDEINLYKVNHVEWVFGLPGQEPRNWVEIVVEKRN